MSGRGGRSTPGKIGNAVRIERAGINGRDRHARSFQQRIFNNAFGYTPRKSNRSLTRWAVAAFFRFAFGEAISSVTRVARRHERTLPDDRSHQTCVRVRARFRRVGLMSRGRRRRRTHRARTFASVGAGRCRIVMRNARRVSAVAGIDAARLAGNAAVFAAIFGTVLRVARTSLHCALSRFVDAFHGFILRANTGQKSASTRLNLRTARSRCRSHRARSVQRGVCMNCGCPRAGPFIPKSSGGCDGATGHNRVRR